MSLTETLAPPPPSPAVRSKRPRRALRRIAVITGTRAEYGLLQSTMRALAKTKGVQLQVVATGMHLLEKFGRTVDQIRADGWRVDAAVHMQDGEDGPRDQAAGLARGITGLAEFLHAEESDIAVVLGDRVEAMAGALAAITTGKLLAHIHGGDLAPGDLDDSLRHAITKLAHLHLAATKSSARRIIRMGEAKERVHVVGAPGLDDLRVLLDEMERGQRSAGQDSRSIGCAPGAPGSHQRAARKAIILHHPCGRAPEHERRVMSRILRAVNDAGLEATCIYPNSDRGSSGIIEAIEANAARNGKLAVPFYAARSLERQAYLRLLIDADVLIGNSSSGIIEAATAGTPVVDIGPRQEGRERSGKSVIHCDESQTAIRQAIARALRLRPIMGAPSVYGDGRAGQRIARLLTTVPLTSDFRRKFNAY